MLKTIFISMLLFSATTFARDDLKTYVFNEVVEHGYAEGILDESISFHLAGSSPLEVSEHFGEFRSNKKTNAFGKSDAKACQWVLLSVLKSFQDRAKSLNGNAVINLKSNYKNNEFVDAEKFQCGAGALMAGVAMIGEVVKLWSLTSKLIHFLGTNKIIDG